VKAIQLIAKHEGYREHMYKCPAGYNTIGYGYNLDAGMPEPIAAQLLLHQAEEAMFQATRDFPWFKGLSEVRQAVIINMIYNLGLVGFKKFKRTIAFIEEEDYIWASTEMLDSKWATQVGSRAADLSYMMATGEWPDS